MEIQRFACALAFGLLGWPAQADEPQTTPGLALDDAAALNTEMVIELCADETATACRAVVLGLYNGLLVGTMEAGYSYCVPPGTGTDRIVPLYVGYLKTQLADGPTGAAFLMIDLLTGLGWITQDFECSTAAATIESDTPEPPADPAILAAGDAAQGEEVFRRCQACHQDGPGERHGVGPNLWGIVGAPVAAADGYAYSAALEAYSGSQPFWDAASLDAYLASPKSAVPGTTMTFIGIDSAEDRADLIAYLASLSEP